MNITKKLTTAVTGAVLAGAIGLGSIAAAAGTDATTPSTTPAVSVQASNTQARCDREPQITARYNTAHTKMTTRLEHLQARHDKAVAAGHTKLANRLQRVIDRLTKVDQKVTTRYQKYETWFAANCKA